MREIDNFSESLEEIQIANECASILKMNLYTQQQSFYEFIQTICKESIKQNRQYLIELLQFAGITY